MYNLNLTALGRVTVILQNSLVVEEQVSGRIYLFSTSKTGFSNSLVLVVVTGVTKIKPLRKSPHIDKDIIRFH